MQPIADWLAKLGMSEYAERFEANRIDVSVLPDLTDQDLEKLGVLLGDRRKILRAIRELVQPVSTSAQDPPPAGLTRDGAERRIVTGVFAVDAGITFVDDTVIELSSWPNPPGPPRGTFTNMDVFISGSINRVTGATTVLTTQEGEGNLGDSFLELTCKDSGAYMTIPLAPRK